MVARFLSFPFEKKFTEICHREQPNITTPFHNHVEATCFLPFLSLVILQSENEIQILSNCGHDRWKKERLLFYWSSFVFLPHFTGSIINPQSPWKMDFTRRQNANFAQRCVNATCPDGPVAYSEGEAQKRTHLSVVSHNRFVLNKPHCFARWQGTVRLYFKHKCFCQTDTAYTMCFRNTHMRHWSEDRRQTLCCHFAAQINKPRM